jgi:SPP1 gp7 family putative phage head morphogenesis protein
VLEGFASELFRGEVEELEARIRCARQPSTLYGSPEALIEKGIDRGITETARWAERIVDAIGNADSAGAIRSQTRAAAKRNDLKAFARNAYERMLHCAALGALDANWEYETGGTVAQPRFVAIPPLPGFADKPFGEAISWFKSKHVLRPDAFRALDASAKRRAFTVARLANEDLLGAVHAELARQLEQGASLEDFKRFAKERLESAGWVPANKSHVELIFRNNVVGAHGAGRRKQMFQPEVLKARPIFQLKGVGDDRMRPRHKKANGKAALATDPVFRHLWTPLGHNCRCRFVSRSEVEAKRLGLELVDGSVLEAAQDPGWESRGPAL